MEGDVVVTDVMEGDVGMTSADCWIRSESE
jgi:hypothetical protein